jgi:hypothetical protein
MRTMNCQNVRREVDETAPSDFLSAFARRHMSACRECRAFSEEHQKLQEILSSLGTIEAPGDFDFRLRARLAGEKAGNNHFPLAFANLSFGFRAAVVATLLVVFGSVAFFNFKPSSNNSLVSNNASPATKTAAAEAPQPAAAAPDSRAVVAVDRTPVAADEGNVVPRRQVTRKFSALASAGNTPRPGIREMGSSPAKSIKASELNARVADYAIESSSQPMKVSLDNGRGSSRTISLPPVSFGSQRVMAQGAAPLMASARGSW